MASRDRFKIGRHFFLEMHPAMLFASQKVSYAVAANTDGASIFKDAVRGELFQVRTVVDANSPLDVRRLIQHYHGTTGLIHEVTYDRQVYGHYLVDHVFPVPIEVLKVVGAVRTSNPTHLVECVWRLYPVREQFDEAEGEDARTHPEDC